MTSCSSAGKTSLPTSTTLLQLGVQFTGKLKRNAYPAFQYSPHPVSVRSGDKEVNAVLISYPT
uniref:Uncharacterized protein n=1 Tax=Oryza sativa subsp. japonica TaxID=39947 RepID=Q69ND9_ORYSJ|nr:hypothetical protein [Oryza sativa Japonica Group]